jgi:SNF2 family DNA or RNA helicase
MQRRAYQQRMTQHMLNHAEGAYFVDMGYGKTMASLDAIRHLIYTGESMGVLVVGPISVIESAWPDEIAKWPEFNALSYTIIRGRLSGNERIVNLSMTETKPNKKALESIAKPSDIYLINYENLASLCEWATSQKRIPFDTIIFDESTKIKAHTSKRFKKLRSLLPRIDRRYILTGTPSPNSMLNLWGQIYAIDHGRSLSPSFTVFRDRFFSYNPWTYQTQLLQGAGKRIQDAIAHLVFTVQPSEIIELPELIHNEIAIVLPKKIMEAYDQFEKKLYTDLLQADIEAVNAAVMAGRCRQLTSGAVYEPKPLDGPRDYTEHHGEKMDAVETILESTAGNAIVLYEFQHELLRLKKRFPRAVSLTRKDSKRQIQLWNAGKIELLLAHPLSMSHGLNLQTGGSTLIWTTLPWSQEVYAQTVKRLHRHGQAKPVVSHRIVAKNTIDTIVWDNILGRHKSQAHLLASLQRKHYGTRTTKSTRKIHLAN